MTEKICPKNGEECTAETTCIECSAYGLPCNGCPINMGASARKRFMTIPPAPQHDKKPFNEGKRLTKGPIG